MSDKEPTTISIAGVTKTYRHWFRKPSQVALQNVTLEVRKGEIFSLLGPNGAGKTTIVRILLGFIFPDAGSTMILGRTSLLKEARERVGYLPEQAYCPPHLTPAEFLVAWGTFAGLSLNSARRKAEELLERMSLLDRRTSKIKEFSKGMVLRLGFAQALMADPEVLILDEPTDGLDAGGRLLFREVLLECKRRGTTILMNSHLLSEVEKISDRVGVITKGKLVRTDNVNEITRRLEEFVVTFESDSSSLVERMARRYELKRIDKRFVISASGPGKLEQVLGALRDGKGVVVGVDQKRLTLEDYFVSVAGE